IAFRRPTLRLAVDRHKLRWPLIGTFITQRDTARFARTLGTLLRAGVPMLQAATSARSVVANRHIGSGLADATEGIREGIPLHPPLQVAGTLPPVAVRMISVGEEAGKLDRMLMRVAVMYEQQTQHTVDRFMTLLTPFLTLVIAAVVGSLVLAVMN